MRKRSFLQTRYALMASLLSFVNAAKYYNKVSGGGGLTFFPLSSLFNLCVYVCVCVSRSRQEFASGDYRKISTIRRIEGGVKTF